MARKFRCGVLTDSMNIAQIFQDLDTGKYVVFRQKTKQGQETLKKNVEKIDALRGPTGKFPSSLEIEITGNVLEDKEDTILYEDDDLAFRIHDGNKVDHRQKSTIKIITEEDIEKYFGDKVVSALKALTPEKLAEVAYATGVHSETCEASDDYISAIADKLETVADLNAQELEEQDHNLGVAVDMYQYTCGVNKGMVRLHAEMQRTIVRDLIPMKESAKAFSDCLSKLYGDLWEMGFLTTESKPLFDSLGDSSNKTASDFNALLKYFETYLTKWAWDQEEKHYDEKKE